MADLSRSCKQNIPQVRIPDSVSSCVTAAALLEVGRRLARLTGRQLAAVEPLLGEELADAVRHCATIPRRNKVGLTDERALRVSHRKLTTKLRGLAYAVQLVSLLDVT